MNISLNQCQWKLKGFWPYVPLWGKSMETGKELLGVTHWVDATVPGGVHFDLLQAGLIEDPYYEMNSLKCEWVENRWWMYKASFIIEEGFKGKALKLIFMGIDYKAHFYLNHKKLGEHKGMYETVTFDVTQLVNYDTENELIVLLENTPKEMSQIGYTSETRTQKSRFNYKWDFATRLVNIGIWDDVILSAEGDFVLEDNFVSTDFEAGKGVINISSKLKGLKSTECTVKLSVDYEDENVYSGEDLILLQKYSCDFSHRIIIENPKLWYPNGYGEQPLYNLKLKLYHENKLSQAYEYKVGIRKLEYRKNVDSPEDSLPYTFVVNNIPIYIKGVNLTPFDHLYGNVSKEKYERYIWLIKNANINMVRVWGGGIIEKEYFYDLCDRNGIMVWQEFIQSSSGIDNIPSEYEDFLHLLKLNSIQAVRTKRNHVSHTAWSGGNELMDAQGVPVTYENPNIKMLKKIVEELDPGKLFLPTSASGPNEGLNINTPGRNHDVHGSWQYEGTVEHYKKYNLSDALFHSEFGVDGLSNLESLQKVLSPENLTVSNMKDNLVWRHHGEWWDTYPRDVEIFGDFDSLEQFIKCSQFVQAEGLRYILEANRRRKFNNSGSIIWQFNEPWPNVACTCLVDYYQLPKMAYYWVKEAYAPLHISLSYDKLVYAPSEEFKGEIFIHNSLETKNLTAVYEILDLSGKCLYMERTKAYAASNSALKAGKINKLIPPTKIGIFFIRLTLLDEKNNECSQNLYIFSQEDKEIFSPLLNLEKSSLKIEKVEEGYSVKNTGSIVSLFVHGVRENEDISLFIDNNYSTLFPGEEKLFKVSILYNSSENCSISWRTFN
jgi:beta-mannosidase